MSNITFVIARYNEPLDFLNSEPFFRSKIFLYNKGPDIKQPFGENIIIRTLPNVGRCDHTYLYHIVNEYDHLDDLLCFLPASWRTEGLKSFRAKKTMHHLQETGSACVVVYDGEMDRLPLCYNFQLDHYVPGNNENRSLNPDGGMELSPVRPFGKWYETYIGKETPLRTDALQGVFSAHKNQIKQRSVSFYKTLLSQVVNHHNPEVGHYLERSWASILSSTCFLHVDRHTLTDIK